MCLLWLRVLLCRTLCLPPEAPGQHRFPAELVARAESWLLGGGGRGGSLHNLAGVSLQQCNVNCRTFRCAPWQVWPLLPDTQREVCLS